MANKEKGVVTAISKTLLQSGKQVISNISIENNLLSVEKDAILPGIKELVINKVSGAASAASMPAPANKITQQYYLFFEGTATLGQIIETKKGIPTGNIKIQKQQIGTGTIKIKIKTGAMINTDSDKIAIGDDGNNLEFDTISGWAGNGLLPDGDYDASVVHTHPTQLSKRYSNDSYYQDSKGITDSFCDATGWSFKIDLLPLNNLAFKVPGFKPRSYLEIHPTYHAMTDGCPGLNGGHTQAVLFWNTYSKIKTKQSKIILKVKIDGNENLGTQKYT